MEEMKEKRALGRSFLLNLFAQSTRIRKGGTGGKYDKKRAGKWLA